MPARRQTHRPSPGRTGHSGGTQLLRSRSQLGSRTLRTVPTSLTPVLQMTPSCALSVAVHGLAVARASAPDRSREASGDTAGGAWSVQCAVLFQRCRRCTTQSGDMRYPTRSRYAPAGSRALERPKGEAVWRVDRNSSRDLSHRLAPLRCRAMRASLDLTIHRCGGLPRLQAGQRAAASRRNGASPCSPRRTGGRRRRARQACGLWPVAGGRWPVVGGRAEQSGRRLSWRHWLCTCSWRRGAECTPACCALPAHTRSVLACACACPSERNEL